MKRIFAGAIFSCVTLFMFPSTGSTQSEDQGFVLLKEGTQIRNKAHSRADFERALAKFEETLAIFEKVGSEKGKGYALLWLGLTYESLNQYTKALECYDTSLVIRQKIGDVKGERATLSNIGSVYRSLGQNDKALEYYQKDLAIAQKIGDMKGAGVKLNNIGLVHVSLGQYAKALECYEKSLAIAQEIGDVKGEGSTLGNIGSVYNYLGQYDKALEYYQKDLEIAQKTGNLKGEGISLNNIGLVYDTRGMYKNALANYEKSLAIMQQIGDVKGEGSALGNIGSIYQFLGQHEKALEYYQKALAIAQKTGDLKGEGVRLNNIGLVYDTRGMYKNALKNYEEALPIRQKTGDVNGEATTLNNLGCVYESLGQFAKALENYEKSLAIRQKIGDVKGEATALSNIGGAYELGGQHQKALECVEKALAISQKIGNVKSEAGSLNKIGVVYSSWGQYHKALDYYEKALVLSKKIGDASQEGTTTNNIGGVYYRLGQNQKALEYFEKSLALAQKTGEMSAETIQLGNIGEVYNSLSQHQKALEYFEKALAIERKNGVPCDGSENSIGNVYLAMGDIQRAEPLFKKANRWVSLGMLALVKSDFNEAKGKFQNELDRSLKNRVVNGLFASHTGLGLSYEGLKQYDRASEHFKEAIDVTEQIRDSLTPAQRADFYDAQIWYIPRITPYEGLARVLLKMGKPEESFKESEGTKARIFAESLSGRSQDIVLDVPKKVVEQDSDINNRLTAFSQGLQKAYEKSSKDAIESFEREVKDVRAEKDRHVDKLRKQYPLYAATKYPQPMNLEHTALKDDEWALEYEVTEPGICIFLIHGKNIVKSLFKPISRRDVDVLVRKFRDPMELHTGDSLVQKLGSFDFASGKKLSDLLLGDILSELPSNSPLIIVPDGSLGVVPFEMLVLNQGGKIISDGKIPQTSGTEFLGDRNPISYYQSVTALTLARTLSKRKKSDDKTLAMVDPVFSLSDRRLLNYAKPEREKLAASVPMGLLVPMEEHNSITFPRLQRTAQLGESLKNLDPSLTDLYQGMDARKSVILGKDLTSYRSLVFATHGYFGKNLPGIQEPVLILTLLDQPEGQDGFLRMSEVMGLNINCDIAALTACQSGLGRNISGEGTMGMGRAFQYAGAKSVLMSLWSVDEAASINLVESFFGHLREGKNKTESLRLARDAIRKAGYDHPFFWSAFILVGETS